MPETKKILIGVGASAVLSVAWELYPQKNQYKLAKLEGNPLAVFEHYHIGLISMITARYTTKYQPYLDGLGAGLIIAECVQSEPFGINKPTFGASTALGLGLTVALILSYV